MHLHFADQHDAIEFGARTATFAMAPSVDGGGSATHVQRTKPATAGPKTHGDVDAVDADKATKLRTQHEAEQKAAKVEATRQAHAGARVLEAVKNGGINSAEAAMVLDPSKPRRGAALLELNAKAKDRIADTLIDADAVPSAYDGRGGMVPSTVKMSIGDDGKLAPRTTDSAHDELVARLGAGRSIDEIKAALAANPNDQGLRDLLAKRTDDESTLLGTMKAQYQYRGTLRVAQEQLKQQTGVDGKSSSDIKAEIEDKLAGMQDLDVRMRDNHDWAGLAGSDWEKDGDLNFDDVENLIDNDKVDEFVERQGYSSDDRFGSVEDAMADATDRWNKGEISSTTVQRIKDRYEAATEVHDLIRDYQTATKSEAAVKDQMDELDTQIGAIDDTIGAEQGLLSGDTAGKLEHYLSNGKLHVYEGDAPTNATTADAGSNGPTGGGHPADDVETGGTGANQAGPGEAPGSTHGAGAPQADVAGRAAVLRQAQKAGYLPTDNVSFDKQGNAVYTVQRGDSYWGIAANSAGPDAADLQNVWQQTWNSNAQQLGRGATGSYESGIIYSGDQIAIAGRSYDDLVKLLEQQRDQG